MSDYITFRMVRISSFLVYSRVSREYQRQNHQPSRQSSPIPGMSSSAIDRDHHGMTSFLPSIKLLEPVPELSSKSLHYDIWQQGPIVAKSSYFSKAPNQFSLFIIFYGIYQSHVSPSSKIHVLREVWGAGIGYRLNRCRHVIWYQCFAFNNLPWSWQPYGWP